MDYNKIFFKDKQNTYITPHKKTINISRLL